MWADADLAPYLRRLGVPGLVDVHVHFMAPPQGPMTSTGDRVARERSERRIEITASQEWSTDVG